MKDFLQGKWLRHPLHPLLVHLPTSLWPAALVFDILGLMGVGGNASVQAAFWAILLGLISAVPAAAAGLADFTEIRREKVAWKLALYHMILNVTATLLWLVNLILRWGERETATQVGGLELALSIAGVAILSVSGYLGGRMVYAYGISIARQSKKEWRERAEKGGARVGQEQ
jgi:uncharacterized membrane protein